MEMWPTWESSTYIYFYESPLIQDPLEGVMGWIVTPPTQIHMLKAHTLGPEKVTLFEERVFTEIIKLNEVIRLTLI